MGKAPKSKSMPHGPMRAATRNGMVLGLGLGLACAISACEPGPIETEPAAGPALESVMVHLLDRGRVEGRFAGGAARFAASGVLAELGFVRVGLRIDGEAPALRWRALDLEEGAWSDAQPVELTWSEPPLHVARIDLRRPAAELELIGQEGIDALSVELIRPIRGDLGPASSGPATPPQARAEPYGVAQFAVAPRDLVIPRAEWGADGPDRICGDVVAPYRISIHHTASPDSDGGDAAARMRQMQSYHMDVRGWCDIGYHFVVAQSGQIYQGRSDERRPGAHVGGENSGNVGISMIGNFEEQAVGAAQLDATVAIVRWLHETYDISLDRTAVRGHREWPGQSTSCPGANMVARLDELVQRANHGAPVDPPDAAPVNPPAGRAELAVRWVSPPADLLTQGTSAGVPDALPDQTVQVEAILTNLTGGVIRGVELGYAMAEPGVSAVDYTIFSDHPTGDRRTWVVNDADAAPNNPPKANMGARGALSLYAFSNGESKRVLIDLRVGQYADVWRPWLRVWVRHIDELYADQMDWDQPPATNHFGGLLQGAVHLDVLSPDTWLFAGDDPQEVEGWSQCSARQADIDTVSHSVGDGTLRAHVVGDNPCLASPPWTSIDASLWDTLVLETQGQDGPHLKSVWWSRDGEVFEAARQIRFEARGDGEQHAYVIAVGDHPDWTGRVTRLRLDPFDGWPEGITPPPVPNGAYGIDSIFLQSAARGATSSPHVDYDHAPPVVVAGGSGPVGPAPDDAGPIQAWPDGGPVPPVPQRDALGPPTAGDRDASRPTTWDGGVGGGGHQSTEAADEGCHCAASHRPTGGPMALGLLALALWLRRRRAA